MLSRLEKIRILSQWHQLGMKIERRRAAEITHLAEAMQHLFSSRLRRALYGLEAVLDLEAHEHLQAVLVKSTEVLLDTSVTQCVIVFREH